MIVNPPEISHSDASLHPIMENVLTRKLTSQGVGRSPIADTEKLGDQFVRLAERNIGEILRVSVSGMVLESEVTRLSTVAEGIPVPALLGVLTFDGAEASTLINLSADVVYHIVDLLMGGDPETCPVPTTRSFTAVDYALLEDVLGAIAKSFGAALSAMLDGPLNAEFQLVDVQQNITNVSIAPDNADVLLINTALDIGDAARGGDVDIVVPLSVLDIVRSSVQKKVKRDEAAIRDIWRDRMKRAAGEADIPLNAILHKAKYKAQFLEELEVGQIIPIPSKAPQNVAIVTQSKGAAETEVALAKLGAFEGKKVLKLVSPPNPHLLTYLTRVMSDG